MEAFRFLKWSVYKDSQSFLKNILNTTRSLPKEYRFEIGSQLNRATLSVVLNIAEGSGKSSDKDFKKYVDISLGSAYEVLACLDVLRINSLLPEKEFENYKQQIFSICSQLGGLKKKLYSGLPTRTL